ncbi:MAG: hypothetical protein LQ346_008421 [Caloplaca aetnensis]|nr:MAG: hypothetical protein LQ346_008421 [Caloplaca aetnensis]
MASDPAFDTRNAEQRVKTLVNAQLKSILKKEKLAVSGLKAAMQNRIISRNHVKNRDLEKFNRLKSFINNPEALQSPATALSSTYNQYQDFHPTVGQKPALPSVMPPGSVGPFKPMFKESPFYTVLEPLTDVHECKALVREATRDQVDCKITLRPDVADRLIADPSIRVMIYCASEPVSQFAKVDIAFPHQVEIKVNLDEVKANLRGLKNKAGSTRPPDITSLLRKRANYENSLSLTYALTHKQARNAANLSKSLLLDSSPARLYLRIRYIDNILKATPRSVDQVTVGPDGKWSCITEGDASPQQSRDSSEDDEDLVEIKDTSRITTVKTETNGAFNLMRTPPASSREQSSSSVPPASSGAKRSVSAVIDLTSDDDEEGDQRPSKRPALPGYLTGPSHHRSESTQPLGPGSSTPFRSFMTNPLSKPNYVNGGYPRPA